jgi:hypothetical protein
MNTRAKLHHVFVTVLAILMVFAPSTLMISNTVQAQVANPLAVPTDCGLSLTCIQNNYKTFIGDRLAVMITNQIIQRMTASIVQWINTGFEGSPSFVTNPEGFFTDVGDQITGEFLKQTGTAKVLCSPFSFDLRLNIALNQADTYNKRYNCTLSTAIANAKNSVANAGKNSGVTLGGSDGVTLGNFMNGDFSQGGWEGFVAYTTQAQNNPIGAWLMTKSDLEASIAAKKAAVNTDLNRGQGFMSWQKCKDVTAQFYDSRLGGESLGLTAAQEEQLVYGSNKTIVTGATNLNKPTSVRTKTTMKDGVPSTSYQNCETQTPGSMIASSLFNQADTGREKLVSVKTISDSIDALTGALVNQMLTQGLAALSNRGSSTGGGSSSYLAQLSEESYNSNSAESKAVRERTLSTTNSIINLAQGNITKYNDTLSLLNASRDKYLVARVCFTNKIAQLNQGQYGYANQKAYGERMIAGIDLVLSKNIDPLMASTTEKKIMAINKLNEYQSTASTTASGTVRGVNLDDITRGFNLVQSDLNATIQTAQSSIESSSNAEQGYRNAQTTVTNLDKDAATFQSICSQYPFSTIYAPNFTFTNPLLAPFR